MNTFTLKTILLSISFIVSGFFVQAQDSSSYKLKSRLAVFQNIAYAQYDMITTGTALHPVKDSISMTYSKTSNGVQSVMNNYYTTIVTPGMSLIVDDKSKVLQVSADSNAVNSFTQLPGRFMAIIDSASSVNVFTSDGKETYLVSFGPNASFKNLKFVFNAQTGYPVSVHSIYNVNARSKIYDLLVRYTVWNPAWTAAANFPNISQYVLNNNGTIQAMPAYKSYKLRVFNKKK